MKRYHELVLQDLELELNKHNINYFIEYKSVSGELCNNGQYLHFVYDLIIFEQIHLAKFVSICGTVLQFASKAFFQDQSGIKIIICKDVGEDLYNEYLEEF